MVYLCLVWPKFKRNSAISRWCEQIPFKKNFLYCCIDFQSKVASAVREKYVCLLVYFYEIEWKFKNTYTIKVGYRLAWAIYAQESLA